MRQILASVLSLIVVTYILNQLRKPDRWLGRLSLWRMNWSHSNLTDWGLKQVQIEKHFTILDVGCGGGRTIQKLAAIASEGAVCGVDFASGSVAASRANNAALIEAGRVDVQKASVSQLPFPDDRFDLVTAVETQYYWPDLVKDMREILRVLKPSGTLVIIAESYLSGRFDWLQQGIMKTARATLLSAQEQRELFATAGYTNVQVFEERSKGWICVTGQKTASRFSVESQTQEQK